MENSYLGFAVLPEQIHRKSIKRGFDFTIMIVGDSGLGKSTMVNSLFYADLYKDRKLPNVEDKVEKTVQIEKKMMEIEERGVKLKLTLVDTPGFNDAVNSENSCRTIENYIDEQFQQYFKDESGLNRKNIQDSRVHCCLYFLPPWIRRLRQIDMEFLKRLHMKVNIIPVIAKADTLTQSEVKKLKERVMEDVEENKIQIYQFPDCDSDEDEGFKKQDQDLKSSIPFAVIGSNQVIEVNGKQVRGRVYPWGVIETDNPEHSDFLKLRTMVISTHMQDLKDITRDVHYENFRAQYITNLNQTQSKDRGKLKNRPGAEDEQADRLLQQKDEEIRRMQEMLEQMQYQLRAAGKDPTPGSSPTRELSKIKRDSVIDL